MTAYLFTLEGFYSPPGRRYRSGRRYDDPRACETMEGLGDFVKSVGKVVAGPVTSTVKGVGHATKEAYRGVKTGDVKKVISAPFKGVGHSIMDTSRTIQEHSEWYYQPSKMSQWMQPVGSSMMIAAPLTGPAAPILLTVGAGLTVTGTAAGKIHGSRLESEARAAAGSPEAQAAAARAAAHKKKQYLYYGLGAAALVSAAMIAL